MHIFLQKAHTARVKIDVSMEWTTPSRRTLLAGLTALVSGCSSRRPADETTESQTTRETTDSETAREPTRTQSPSPQCDHAEVTYTSVSIESFQSDDGATLYEDYVGVAGMVSGPHPPDLHVSIEAPEAPDEYVRSFDGEGSFSFRFGPFSHNGVGDITTWLENCGDSPTPKEE
jgi:hypothetical protein